MGAVHTRWKSTQEAGNAAEIYITFFNSDLFHAFIFNLDDKRFTV